MTEIVKKEIEYWPVDRLIPYDKNAKKHPPEQIKRLANIIKSSGWSPAHAIIVDRNGVIIGGHGRRLAAIELKLDRVPVVVRDDLTPEGVRLMRLTDNEAAGTQYDTELKAIEIRDLVDVGLDLSGLFDDRDLEFSTDELDEMNLDALTDDLDGQLQRQANSTANAVDIENEREVTIGKLLPGKLSAKDRKILTRWIALAEGETGLEGLSAVISYIAEEIN